MSETDESLMEKRKHAIGGIRNQVKAISVNVSHGNDRLLKGDIVLVEQNTVTEFLCGTWVRIFS